MIRYEDVKQATEEKQRANNQSLYTEDSREIERTMPSSCCEVHKNRTTHLSEIYKINTRPSGFWLCRPESLHVRAKYDGRDKRGHGTVTLPG